MKCLTGIDTLSSAKKSIIFFAAFGAAGAVFAQSLEDVPAKYVSACYDFDKGRNEVGSLSPEQLTQALKKMFEKNPPVERTFIEQGSKARNIAWVDQLAEKKDCYRRDITFINLQAAVADFEREKEKREDNAKADAQAKFLREHADDPVTVDYNSYHQTVAGRTAQARKPAGSVRSLKLSQYLDWERKLKEKWPSAVMQAGGRVSVLQAHRECKTDIAEQWKTSFGYVDAVLHSPALLSQGVTRALVTSIACMTDQIKMAGIPVTNDFP